MPRIFISYRRADSKTIAGRIYDRLVRAFGRAGVFKDVDNIPPGTDFREVLQEATATCDVMLVVIGKEWLSITGEGGGRRLDDPGDFVRIEVETGLRRPDMQVIPILVEGASHPAETSLPDALKPLAFKNSLGVREDPDFHRDMDRLVDHLRQTTKGRPSLSPRVLAAAAIVLVALIGALAFVTAYISPVAQTTPIGASDAGDTEEVQRGTSIATPEADTIVFGDTFDDNSSEWELKTFVYGSARISQGRLLLTANQDALYGIAVPGIQRDAFYADVSVEPLSVSNISVGLAIGSDSGNKVHLFLVGEYDGWRVRIFDYDGETLTPLIDSARDPIWRVGDTIRVGLNARDEVYTLYVDGVAQESLQLDRPVYGDEILLVVQSPGDGAQAYFDDVTVRE